MLFEKLSNIWDLTEAWSYSVNSTFSRIKDRNNTSNAPLRTSIGRLEDFPSGRRAVAHLIRAGTFYLLSLIRTLILRATLVLGAPDSYDDC